MSEHYLDLSGLSEAAQSEVRIFIDYIRRRDRGDAKRIVFEDLPSEIISKIGDFLPGADVLRLAETSRFVRAAALFCMRNLGELYFRGIVVKSQSFSEACASLGVHRAFNTFMHSFRFTSHRLTANRQPDELVLQVPDDGSHSFTVPLGFAVSRDAEVFLDFATEIHFGPDVIRSVVGVIDSLDNLDVDRAMEESATHGFGLAFGPLSGVLSRGGKYFDQFHTFATGPFIRDFLATATVDTVGLRIGLFFSKGRIAFYRLAEEDGDWECTGFIYEMTKDQPFMYPCFMFSRVTAAEDVFFHIRAISDHPPFMPHVNEDALDFENNWLDFEDETLGILRGDAPHPDVLREQLAWEVEERRRLAVVPTVDHDGDVFADNEALLTQLQLLRDRYIQLARE